MCWRMIHANSLKGAAQHPIHSPNGTVRSDFNGRGELKAGPHLSPGKPGDDARVNADDFSESAKGDFVVGKVCREVCHGHMMHKEHQERNRQDAYGAFAKTMHQMHDLGMNLRRIREAKKLSQRDLADLVGVDQATIQRAEKMASSAKLTTYKACADALGVPLVAIFTESLEEAALLSAFQRSDGEGRRLILALANEAKAQPQPPSDKAN